MYFSIESRAKGMIDRMVRNLISREANVDLKPYIYIYIYIYIQRPHIKYCIQANTPVFRY